MEKIQRAQDSLFQIGATLKFSLEICDFAQEKLVFPCKQGNTISLNLKIFECETNVS